MIRALESSVACSSVDGMFVCSACDDEVVRQAAEETFEGHTESGSVRGVAPGVTDVSHPAVSCVGIIHMLYTRYTGALP